jgi:methyl coenzyme M reductase beta subunit
MAAAVVLSDVLVHERIRGHRVSDGSLYPVTLSVPLAATQLDDTDDKTIFFEAPPRTFLWGAKITLTDLDTATNLVWDLSTATATDGTVGTVLISNSTVGRSAGSDFLDADLAPVDISELYLMFHVNTAGTTAGTLTADLLLSEKPPTAAGVSSITAARLAAAGEDQS